MSTTNVVMLALLAAAGAYHVAYVDGWHLIRNEEGSICVLERPTQENTVVRIRAFAKQPEVMQIALSNPSWRSIKVGQAYPLAVMFGKLKVAGDAQGEENGLAINLHAADVRKNLSDNASLKVVSGQQVILETGIRGYDAQRAIVRCTSGGVDPFAK